MEQRPRSLPRTTTRSLKLIALVTMFLDHAGVAVGRQLFGISGYWTMRSIGRIAFPLFAFLLVEGFRHTRSRRKYLRNLLIFAAVSELPFDLLFWGWQDRGQGCNIFWTLALGLLGMMAAEAVKTWLRDRPAPVRGLGVLLGMLCFVILALAADILRTDYGDWGVALIAVLYYTDALARIFPEQAPRWRLLANALSACGILLWMSCYDLSVGFLNESRGAAAILPLLLYSGERGNYRLPKWFFYGFYPAHLTALLLLSRLV